MLFLSTMRVRFVYALRRFVTMVDMKQKKTKTTFLRCADYTGNDKQADLFCLFDLILLVPSTIFQLNRDGSSGVEPVLS